MIVTDLQIGSGGVMYGHLYTYAILRLNVLMQGDFLHNRPTQCLLCEDSR